MFCTGSENQANLLLDANCVTSKSVILDLREPPQRQFYDGSTQKHSISDFLRSDNARRLCQASFPISQNNIFPEVSRCVCLAIDLAEQMLVFDPAKRITGMLRLHEINEVAHLPSPFNFDFEQGISKREDIKELIWRASFEVQPR
nr:mitogen-activated protein kinase homolog NTF6 [Ipomoea batatas]